MLDRSLVDTFDVAEFLGTLQAAVARDVEERIVHRLGHDHELVGLRECRGGHHRDGHAGKKKLPHCFPPHFLCLSIRIDAPEGG